MQELTQKILTIALLIFTLKMQAQITCSPAFPTQSDNVIITFDAKKGNAALASTAPPIYAHMGVITDKSTSPTDWKYVKTTWGVADPKGLMTTVSPGIYSISFNIQSFFAVPGGEVVKKLAFVFRNTDGSVVGRASDGSDIFYDVYPANAGLQTVLFSPEAKSFVANSGQQIAVKGAASKNAALQLLDNGSQIHSVQGQNLDFTMTAGAAGLHQVLFVAAAGAERDTSDFSYFVAPPVVVENPPAGTETGIQYLDNQRVRLSLYAPKKTVAHVVGDFNDWKLNPDFQMKRSVDGNTFWIEIGGLTAGQIYRFQYLVDGTIKIADPLSTLVLDPWNDGFIPALTFPNLPSYPTGKTTGTVSILQTAQQPFNWQSTNYVRPDKTTMVVYEALLRDFLAIQNFQTLQDTLDYLQNLGINTLELMPVNEFGGNLSWGYNPDFHKALDKFYGTPEAFKRLVDECHRRNMAVVVDAVFNHITGANPLAQLYWNAAKSQPAADNPWLNETAKHDFNVFYDMNHESQATKDYMMNCLKYWLTEYRVDGFRFDLSKGFTQKNTVGSVSNWGLKDDSRIAIWKNYADKIWAIDPNAYLILEHFAENAEEKILAEYGFLLWGNMWGAYKDIALGFPSNSSANLTGIAHTSRGWSKPHLVGYFESHDEDRIGYECKTYGNSAMAGYNVKNKTIGMRRIELLNALFYTVPGPKMLWQFGELGYDYSINHCTNGTVNNACRLDPKPVRWDFLQDPERRRVHAVIRSLIHLRRVTGLDKPASFSVSAMAGGKVRWNSASNSNYTCYAIGNTQTTTESNAHSFNASGKWYEYFTGDSIQVTAGVPFQFSMKAGEYRIYLNKKVALPAGVKQILTTQKEVESAVSNFQVFPNPSGGELNLIFNLKENSRVRAEVFDLAGRRVALLFDQNLGAGEQVFSFETGLAAGSYFLRVSDSQGLGFTRKLLIF